MIPVHRYINRDDLLLLDPREVVRQFEKDFLSLNIKISLECFDVIKPILQDLFNLLNDGDVLLVPGDSAFKIIHVMRLNHEIEPDLFIFDDVVKRITILDFPLSNAARVLPEQLDAYILDQLEANNVSLNSNFVMYDFVNIGTTYRALRTSLGRLKRLTLSQLPPYLGSTLYYGDSVLSLINMDTTWYRIKQHPDLVNAPFDYLNSPDYLKAPVRERDRIWKLYNDQFSQCTGLDIDAMTDAENTDSRCVVRYDFKTKSLIGSLYRCNLIIALLALSESMTI